MEGAELWRRRGIIALASKECNLQRVNRVSHPTRTIALLEVTGFRAENDWGKGEEGRNTINNKNRDWIARKRSKVERLVGSSRGWLTWWSNSAGKSPINLIWLPLWLSCPARLSSAADGVSRLAGQLTGTQRTWWQKPPERLLEEGGLLQLPAALAVKSHTHAVREMQVLQNQVSGLSGGGPLMAGSE